MLKFKPYLDGKNSSIWHMMSAHSLDLHEVDEVLYPTAKKDFMHTYDDQTLLVYRDIDKHTGQTSDGHYFTAEELHDHEESPHGIVWTVLDTDFDHLLVMYNCREVGDELNAKGQSEIEVAELMSEKRQAEIDEHDSPIVIKKIRDALTVNNIWTLQLAKFRKEDVMNPRYEHKALRDIAEEVFPGRFTKDFLRLGTLGAAVWRRSLHNYFTMDEGKLEMIAEQRANKSAEFAAQVAEKKYGDEIDQNFNEVFAHDIIMNIYVKDVSIYQNELELEALKDRIFKKFAEPVNRDVILSKTVKMPHDGDVCTHYAKGKSIFGKDKLLSIDEQGDFFTKMYDKSYEAPEHHEDFTVEGQEVYRDLDGNIQEFTEN